MTDFFKTIRNSHMEFGEVYFWTDTVKDWKPIFTDINNKMIVLSSLKELVLRGKISIYAYVVMPNHLHLIWEMSGLNGKEMPHASFNKYTSHMISKGLKLTNPAWYNSFLVNESDRSMRIWQRDPLAILMDTVPKLEQKIEYIHSNPLQSHWNLASRPEEYAWSSAEFYETGKDRFGFLTDYRERF